MTNDRRKTFNTPLEFVRWASEFPGQRKASSPNTGAPFYFFVSSVDAYIAYGEGSNRSITTEISPIHFPLTAVEDEHGVIPEGEQDDSDPLFEAIYDVMKEPTLSCKIGLAKAIRKEIDERIAAAAVEPRKSALILGPYGSEFVANVRTLYLKPKGDL